MRRPVAANGGFTLLELLIAVAIFSLLAAGLANLLRAGFQIKQRTQAHQKRMQVAERVLEDISHNLRNAVGQGADDFQGTRHEVAFLARQIAWQPNGEHRYRLRRLAYRYDSGSEQIRKAVTDPQTALSTPHLLCEDGVGLRFQYRTQDEKAGTHGWVNDWSTDERPAAVRIELVFSEKPGAQDVWSRVVAVPQVKTVSEE